MASAKNKRILIVCQHFWPESFRINDIADYLVEQGHEVDVLCGLPNYPKGKLFDGYGVFKNRRQLHGSVRIIRSLEIPRGNNTNWRILINYVSFPFFSLFKLPRLLTRHYDHILIYQLSPVMMALPGILLGRLKRVPTSIYIMDLWPENFLSVIKVKNKLLLSILTRHSHWYYKKATNLVGMSQTMTSHLRAITDKDMRHTVTIPQTSEKLYERTIIDKVLVKKFGSTFNVLFTGNISPAQSFDTMIAAAKLLKEKGFSDVRWIIVGDGMSKQSVEAKVTAEGLDKVFVFEGSHPTERMPAYTNIADVLVGCLVKSELLEATIPAKVMSYIASGKPMVLAMDGEVQDLINNTIRCGYAGPTEDAKILASNIEKIHRLSKKDRGAMGRRARDYHFKHLERSVILGQLERFMFTN